MASIQHPYLFATEHVVSKVSDRNPRRVRYSDKRWHDAQEVPGLEEVVRQLFHMTLVSLRGYREISHLSVDGEVDNLVSVLIQQRAAQCRSLSQLSQSLHRQLANLAPGEELGSDPSADELHLIWLRTIWSFEQDELGRFADNIELAEAALEDAYLHAANAFQNTGVAGVFRQGAMTICGARQRLEEVCYKLVHEQE